MDWISMTVRTTTEGAEAVSAMFMELGIMGAMIEDKADVAVNQRPSGFWDILGDEIAARMEDDVKVTVYIAADERAQDTVAHVRQGLRTGRKTGRAAISPSGWADTLLSSPHGSILTPSRRTKSSKSIPAWRSAAVRTRPPACALRCSRRTSSPA